MRSLLLPFLFYGSLNNVITSALSAFDSPLWPLPADVNVLERCYSSNSLKETLTWLSFNFSFVSADEENFEPLLRRAANRYEKLINGDAIAGTDRGRLSVESSSTHLLSCKIDVEEQLSTENILGADESYGLVVTSASRAPACMITASTVWGAMRAMETFSQLLLRMQTGEIKEGAFLICSEVEIQDAPAFSHRGLLIDSARHYLPLNSIRRVIDSLPFNKLNVLHWHIVDAQSFPLHCPSEPLMTNAAFQTEMVYSQQDLQLITEYARDRGVQLLLELDVPGHAAAWTKSHPELMARCFRKYSYNINDFALNPALNETYNTLRNILSDTVQSLLGGNEASIGFFHLGGDEVVYGCWEEDESITNFMSENGIGSYNELLSYFVKRADDILIEELNVSAVIHWNEVFSAGYQGNRDNTLFQVWTDNTQIDDITSNGYRAIASPYTYWYLDVSENTWDVMYDYEPTANLSDPVSQQPLVIGGEVALWGETVDETNIEQMIYPRTSAAAEVLWGKQLKSDDNGVLDRLISHRCRLLNRGVRSSPVQPGGYCDVVFV